MGGVRFHRNIIGCNFSFFSSAVPELSEAGVGILNQQRHRHEGKLIGIMVQPQEPHFPECGKMRRRHRIWGEVGATHGILSHVVFGVPGCAPLIQGLGRISTVPPPRSHPSDFRFPWY